MAPVVIADSDDDDSSYSPPPKTPAPISRPDLNATRSLGTTDRSGSTDSAFFRSILDEQIETVRNHARTSNIERTPLSAVESFDARTMMSTDPLQGHEGDVEMDIGKENVFEAPGQKVNDPWEIPSSPEVRLNSAATKKPTKKERKKTPKGKPKKPTPSIPAEDTSPLYGEDEHRSSKRRKIEPSQGQTQDSDEIDLVKLPSTLDADGDQHTPSTMPPPTLPVEKMCRIVGNILSDSQKKQYQSFAATGGTELSQDQGPTRLEDAAPIIRSSSSATNMNTPRSDPVTSSRNMDTIPEQEDQTPVKEGTKTLAGHWHSSPDEISAAVEQTPTAPRTAKRKQGKKKTPAQRDEETTHKPDTSHEKQQGAQVHYDDNDEESDFMEKPAAQKPKRQRGRPKKTSDAASVPGPTKPTTSHAAEGRSVTKGKRKRGRPKKTEQQAVEEVEEGADIDTRVGAEGPEVTKAEGDILHDQQEAAEDAGPVKSAPQARDESKPLESPEKQQALTTSDRKTPEETTEVDEAGQSRTSKATPRPPILTTNSLSASKPIYRVGLSKRSRIAPLLKIRK